MIRLSGCIILVIFIVSFVTSDVLEAERSSFFGFTHEVQISGTTMELVQALTEAVMLQSAGDRPVRRYFQRYDTPFVGEGRRKGTK